MKESMRSKLAQLARRLEEIDVTLQDPDIASNMDRFRALSKERAEIEPIVQKTKEFEKADCYEIRLQVREKDSGTHGDG